MKFEENEDLIEKCVCSRCQNTIYISYIDQPKFCKRCMSYDTFECEEVGSKVIHQYCPICDDFFKTSYYLEKKIKNKHVRWLANMITHYRHEHITSWNNTWNKGQYGSIHLSQDTYEKEKIKVNERAKRQILRKCKNEMIKDGFMVKHVKQLQHTDNKTIELYEKYLEK